MPGTTSSHPIVHEVKNSCHKEHTTSLRTEFPLRMNISIVHILPELVVTKCVVDTLEFVVGVTEVVEVASYIYYINM